MYKTEEAHWFYGLLWYSYSKIFGRLIQTRAHTLSQHTT